MFIQTEATPNPATIKFIPGPRVMERGVAEFRDVTQAQKSPLATKLFGIQGVAGVFYGADFISVTKAPEKEWDELKARIMASIMDHYTSGMPLFNEVQETAAAGAEDDEITKQIRELLDTRVRPAVAMDGGDIEFDRFEKGIVYLRMRGACSGCPSSTATLKSGIENMLRHYVPEVLEVRPAEDY